MKHTLLLLSLLYLPLTSMQAQEDDRLFADYRQSVAITGSLYAHGSDPAYGMEVSYTYMPIRWLGASASLGFKKWVSMSAPPYSVPAANGLPYKRSDDGDVIRNLFFTLGPTLRSPVLTVGKQRDHHLFLQMDPALLVSIVPNEHFSYARPYQGGRELLEEVVTMKGSGGSWLAWRVQTALSYTIDHVALSVGYALSNEDPYTGRRHLQMLGNPVPASMPAHKITRQFFARIAIGL